MTQHRPFTTWLLIPPVPATPSLFQEPATLDLIWKWLWLPATDAALGRGLFTGTVAQRNVLWRDFRNYIRQANTYDDACRNIVGSSAALLLYYSVLNLAKAELLTYQPATKLNQPIRHGLVMRKGTGDSISGDSIVVTDGVFPLLYQKRTGVVLPLGTKIPIRRLLAQVPEIGWELERCGVATCKAAPFLHAVVWNNDSVWSIIAQVRPEQITNSRATNRIFSSYFEPVDAWTTWRDTFGVTKRFIGNMFSIFQARVVSPRDNPGTTLMNEGWTVAIATWKNLRPIIDYSVDAAFDSLICPSLYKHQAAANAELSRSLCLNVLSFLSRQIRSI